MKITTIIIALFMVFPVFSTQATTDQTDKTEQRIFVYGGDIELKFVEYVSNLINKPEPRICYLPTASADHADNIKYWEYICKELGIEPHILKVWIDSDTQKQSFEDILLSMDAIVVGGGNTLNMLGIWKYQGIDKILRKALDKGIILSGGSAGSICWFKNAVSDARPVDLSVVDGLNILPYSHCPHYNIVNKKTLYHQLIKGSELQPGYACDEHSGILFTNKKVTDIVSSKQQAHSYFISRHKGDLKITPLKSRILLRNNAIDTTAYYKEIVLKEIKELTNIQPSMQTPLSSFITIQNLFAEGKFSEYQKYAASSIKEHVKDMEDQDVNLSAKASRLSTKILALFIYGDFAAVLSKGTADFYSLWYFSKEQGEWKCRGEDIGGNSPEDAEIKFREKAPFLVMKVN